jgi:8-oxo-dGTP pyrophosphatase MutT (NUDIX family)
VAKGRDGGSGSPSESGARPPGKVRAGGGLVWRQVPAGTEVVLVHRPAYDDWALPKGKAKPLESDEQTALREVKEETGLSCRLGQELPSTTYVDAEGRVKTVRYWSMTVIPGPDLPIGELVTSFADNHEVDEVCWAPLDQARQRLTYPRDVVVLDAFEHLISVSNVRRQQVNDILEGKPEGHQAN